MKYPLQSGLALTCAIFCGLQMPASAQDYVVTQQTLTQGLARHGTVGPSSFYDLVVGKDILIEAVVRPVRGSLTSAGCVMRYPAGLRTYDAQISLAGVGLQAARCWIPGADLHREGDYNFTIALGMPGPQFVNFPTTTFQRSGMLRLMVVPLVRPLGHPQYQAWSDAFVLNVVESLSETNRRFPMATGIGNFVYYGRGAGALRFDLLPPSNCVAEPGEQLEAARVRCDGRNLAAADFLMRFYNSLAARSYPGADLFDLAWLAVPMQATNGGLGCQGAQRVIGSGLDANPTGGSATTIAHEIAHCMGQVTAASPNLLTDGIHSRTWTIALPPGEALVDMRRRQRMGAPVSLMHPSVANVFNTYFEAFEWNSLRRGLVSRTGLLADARPSGPIRLAALSGAMPLLALQNAAPDVRLFGLLATVRPNGALTVDYAGDLGVLSQAAVTPSSQDGPFFLDFLDRSGRHLGSHGFSPRFDFPDRRLEVTGASVMAPLPPGTRTIAVRYGNRRLQQFICDGAAPALGSPRYASESGRAKLRWSARQAGGRPLFHSVWFARGEVQPPMLLEAGRLPGEWQTDGDFLPATTRGRFTVSASDGCNVASASSGPVSIARRAPIARFRLVPHDQVSGSAEHLAVAAAWDNGDGVLTGDSLQWRVDGKAAGKGNQVRLRGARSKVSLVVRNSAGLQTIVNASD